MCLLQSNDLEFVGQWGSDLAGLAGAWGQQRAVPLHRLGAQVLEDLTCQMEEMNTGVLGNTQCSE